MAEEMEIDQEYIDANMKPLRQCFTELGIETEPTPKTVADAALAFGDKFFECLKGWKDQDINFDGSKLMDTVKTAMKTVAPSEPDAPTKTIAGLNPVLFFAMLIAVVLIIIYFVIRAKQHTPA